MADWNQTRQFAKGPDGLGHDYQPYLNAKGEWVDPGHEGNPLLGRRPSQEHIDLGCLLGAAVHYGLARALSPKWRARFQYVTLGLSATAVTHNYRVGYKIRF